MQQGLLNLLYVFGLICIAQSEHTSLYEPKCPAQDPNGQETFLPASDCQHFYKCDNGVAVLETCPGNLEWNNEAKACDYPERAHCHPDPPNPTPAPEPKPTPAPEPNPTPQPSPPSGCPAVDPPDHDVLLPAADCQHFYKCNHGIPVIQACPAGLEWNDAKKYCDYPENANCHRDTSNPTAAPQPKSMSQSLQTSPPLPSGCPAVNPIDHDVLLPAADCQHFYKCNNGVPVLQACPAGLEWNDALKQCDWPASANCHRGSKPIPAYYSTRQYQISSKAPQPYPSKCPADNPTDEDVLLPASDCHHFYKCDHGVAVLQECPEGLEWNDKEKYCDYPENANCHPGPVPPNPTTGSQPNPTTKAPQPNPPQPSKCPAVNPIDHDVLLPAADCQHFYKCNHGIPVLQTCPAGLEWNDRAKYCDYPENANCHPGPAPNPTPGPQPISTPKPPQPNPPQPSKCPAVNPIDHDVLLPAADCQHFYKCNHGIPVLQECPEGLEWNDRTKYCDYPENANCHPGPVPPNPTKGPQPNPTPKPPQPNPPNPSKCPAVNPIDHDVLLPAADCQHFYKCNHGIPVLQECPEGLEWNDRTKYCDYPENANCHPGPVPPNPAPGPQPKPPQPSPPQPSACPPVNPVDHDVFLPAADCQHFYKCSNGIAVFQACPSGLEWNDGLKQCDWPEKANCRKP